MNDSSRTIQLTDARLITDDKKHRLEPVYDEFSKYTSLFNILRGFEEFTLNAFGSIISSNLEAVNITGYEEWEVIGKPISMFYQAPDRAAGKPDQDLLEAKETGKIVVKGWRLKKRNVSFWAKVKIEYLKSSNHGPAVYRMVIHDATHKAMYRYRVKKIKSEYLNLFNNSYTGIFRFRHSNGHVMLMNDKALEIVGLQKDERFSFRDLFFDESEFERFSIELQIQERVLDFEFKSKCRADEDQWLSVTCKYFYDEDFVEGIMTDVTEKKKQVLELERLNHELDQFIYHASHDLRSPLTTLLGLVNLINLEKPSSTIQQYSGMMEERVQHLDRLLKDLVSITFNNKTGLVAELFSLESEVKSALCEFTDLYPAVKVQVNISGDSDFHTDAVRARLIIRNIISNALKYHHEEAPSPKLTIDITCDSERVVLKFTDNGIGIEEKYHDLIFEMFYRATAKHSGTGLGLYIVKSMVEKLNGRISLTSAKGIGTKFIVELPNQMPDKKLKSIL